MFKPFVLFAALRYLRSKRRNRFDSIISFASVAGIALGVAALVIVLSVMNGFEREVTRHVLGMTAHATVFQLSGTLRAWTARDAEIRAHAEVVATAPYARARGMLSHRGRVKGVVVEGIEPQRERGVTELSSYVSEEALAALATAGNGVLIGKTLAAELQAAVGSTVTLVIPRWDADRRFRTPRYVQLTIVGTFSVGMHQFDSNLVLAHIGYTQRIFEFGDAVSGIRVRFEHAPRAPATLQEVVELLGPGFSGVDWTQYHRNFFTALKSQKRIMFVVLVLIIAVAAFNIAANIVMLVTEKTADIAILRTMGTSRRRIVALFLLQGLSIGIAGAMLGAGLGAWGAAESGVVATLIEGLLKIDLINPDVYFIDYLPAELRFGDVIAVTSASLVLSVCATLYPALKAAAIDPAQAVSVA